MHDQPAGGPDRRRRGSRHRPCDHGDRGWREGCWLAPAGAPPVRWQGPDDRNHWRSGCGEVLPGRQAGALLSRGRSAGRYSGGRSVQSIHGRRDSRRSHSNADPRGRPAGLHSFDGDPGSPRRSLAGNDRRRRGPRCGRLRPHSHRDRWRRPGRGRGGQSGRCRCRGARSRHGG